MDIILIIFDSLRQDHVGAYGNPWIKTPHLDAFAREAAAFTRCYAESMPTLPARRTLHTGRRTFPYHGHRAMKGDVDGVPGWGPIPEDQDTISETLGRQGYRSALVSDCYHLFKPTKNFHRGFDSFHWIRGQEADKYRSGPPISDREIENHLNPSAQKSKGLAEFLKMYKRNTRDQNSEQDYFPARVFRTASEWYRDNLDADKLFLMIDSFDPHEPWSPPPSYRRLYDQNEAVTDLIQSPYHRWDGIMTPEELKRLQANYAGEVTLCDHWFGSFMDELKRSGRLDRTLIAVVSDHGHNLGYDPGDRGLVGKQGHPLTRGVADLVCLLKAPGQNGMVCPALMYNHDLVATLLDLAGIRPANALDGLSLGPVLSGKESGIREHVVLGWGPNIAVITDQWWYTANIFGQGQILYDMEADPNHEHDLAKDREGICRDLLALAVDAAGGSVPPEFRAWSVKGNSKLYVFGSGQPYCTVSTLARSSSSAGGINARLKMLGY